MSGYGKTTGNPFGLSRILTPASSESGPAKPCPFLASPACARGTELIGYLASTGESMYYRSNVHGDVKELTNALGEVLTRYTYDAYGQEEAAEENPFRFMFQAEKVHNPFRYTGEYTDDETGYIYLRARMYDPSVGRFTSEDPVKDGVNWYTYCGNNPVNYKDSTGLWMEGDEFLSQGAQTYTKYYGQRWQEDKNKYDSYIARGDITGAKTAQMNMDRWHSLADEIRAQDAQGTLLGSTLNVPKYNQLNTAPKDSTNNLCWATSTAMIASFQLGDTTDRTLAIAQSITGSTVVVGYNQPWVWVSTDDPALGLGITAGQIQIYGNLTMEEIQTAINGGNPFGVLYNDGASGHWVVGIGYATAPGHDPLVVSNNPWGGIQRICTYNEFQTCGPNDPRPWVYTAQ